MRRLSLAITLAALSTLATAGMATANHVHYLETPGTTVEDFASGQTSKCATDPGGHQLHENVHFGVPGTFAFAQAGKVSVYRLAPPTC